MGDIPDGKEALTWLLRLRSGEIKEIANRLNHAHALNLAAAMKGKIAEMRLLCSEHRRNVAMVKSRAGFTGAPA